MRKTESTRDEPSSLPADRWLEAQHGALPLPPSPQNGFQISRIVKLLHSEQTHGHKYSYTGTKRYWKMKKLIHASFSSGTFPKWVIEQTVVWQPGHEKQQYPGRGRLHEVFPQLPLLCVSPPLRSLCWLQRGNPGLTWEGLGHRDCVALPPDNKVCHIP